MPIEKKVKASSGAALIAGIIDWLLAQYVFKGTDPGLTAPIYAAIPAVIALAAGYLAPHTPRTPLPVITMPPPPPSGGNVTVTGGTP